MFFQTKNQVPDIYTTESRDFQLLEAILDIVFNAEISNTHAINYLRYPLKINSNLLQLMCGFEGFFTDLYYPEELLRSILLNFPNAIKNKGTIDSMRQLVKALQSAYSNTADVSIQRSTENNSDQFTYTIYIIGSAYQVSRAQIDDLLRYVKPIGILIDNVYFSESAPRTITDINQSEYENVLTLTSTGRASSASGTSGYLYGQIRTNGDIPAGITIDNSSSVESFAEDVLSSVGHTPIQRSLSYIQHISGEVLESPAQEN